MRGHIVPIFGLTRSGKDTFIKYLYFALEERGAVVDMVSSIDRPKNFFDDVCNDLGTPVVREYSQPIRQALADVKFVLDKTFNWTVLLAKKTIDDMVTNIPVLPSVLIYQVREVENIKALQVMCRQNAYGCTTVFLHRPSLATDVRGPATGGATTEIYRPDDWQIADFVIRNEDIDELPNWAEFIANKIMREFNLGNKSSVHGSDSVVK